MANKQAILYRPTGEFEDNDVDEVARCILNEQGHAIWTFPTDAPPAWRQSFDELNVIGVGGVRIYPTDGQTYLDTLHLVFRQGGNLLLEYVE